MSEFIDYDQLYLLLNKKFKATHAELRYWIKCDYEGLFTKGWTLATIPKCEGLYPFLSDICGASQDIDLRYFYPECFFYLKAETEKFLPISLKRFVTVSDLVIVRNWIETTDTSRYTILRKAAEMGLLRYYDKDNDCFTHFYQIKLGSQVSLKKWHETDFMNNHIENPNSFFLLEDILKTERFFFKKPLALCEAELGLEK